MVESVTFGRLRNFLVKEDAHPALLRAVRSRNQIMDHVAMNVGEAIVTPRIAVGELLVVEAHEVKNGRVEVVDAGGVFFSFGAEVVTGAVTMAFFDAGPGEEASKGIGVVVAAGSVALQERHATEFGSPDL